MSFSLIEIINSVVAAIIFGICFAAFWALPSALFKSAFMSVLGVVFFGIGFMLLSYLCLDGVIRLYMFLFAFSSFALTKKYIFYKIIFFMKKMAKKVARIPLFGRRKSVHILDKSKE